VTQMDRNKQAISFFIRELTNAEHTFREHAKNTE